MSETNKIWHSSDLSLDKKDKSDENKKGCMWRILDKISDNLPIYLEHNNDYLNDDIF